MTKPLQQKNPVSGTNGIGRRRFLQATMGGAMAYTLGGGSRSAPATEAAKGSTAGNAAGTASARTPNILFFFGEHHRWDWLGLLGNVPVRTPTLDRLARDGMLFEECRCSSPLCAPSRAGLATGLRYQRAGVPDNRADLDPAHATFMKELRNAGYRVAVCGKTDLHKKSHLHGIDGWSARLGQLGFTDAVDMCGKRDSALVNGCDKPIEPYMAWLHELGLAETVCADLQRRVRRDMDPVGSGQGIATEPFPLARKYQIDDFCGECARDMLLGFPRQAPWFLQINWGSAHPPFDAATELLERYQRVEFPFPVDSTDHITNHQAVRRQYAAMIEGMDEWMGRIIQAVASRGELDNTIIAYSADHGEMLGDHGMWNKSRPLEPAVHVPLILKGPGIRQGAKTRALVELIDLAATFVGLAGIRIPAEWDARSLTRVLSGDLDTHRDLTVSALSSWRMACDGRYKYIEQPRGKPSALYDLATDPLERSNLLSVQPALARRLQERLRQEVETR